jgi:erythritol kinase
LDGFEKRKGSLEMVVISVDAGTSIVKAVAFADDGTEQAVARRSVPIGRPQPGWSEQDMHSVWQAVEETIREVVQRVGSDVSFLSITAQGDGCWLIDDAGDAVGPAILWNDGRAAGIVEQWYLDGTLEQAFRLNGTVVFPGAQSAILRWLYEHDPQRIKRAKMALYCKDWLVLKLTGVAGTDESDASFPFFDIRARQYAPDLLRLYGVEWAERLLAPIRPNTLPVGELSSAVAQSLGLRPGLPVIAAPYDIAATSIGLGAVKAGQALSILGTTLCTEVVIDAIDTSGPPTGLHVCAGLPDRWIRGFASMCGTEAVSWYCHFLGDMQPSMLSAMAASVEPGAGGVVFLPYLSPAGERAPFLNAHARASLFGLSLEQTREHVARAVLEGLSFVIRECLDASSVRPTELHVCGGGAASELWCQMIADITCIPVSLSAATEVGALGAMLIGLAATGGEASIEVAAHKYARTSRSYLPNASIRGRYEELYRHFLEVRDCASMVWPRQAEIRRHLRA